MKHIKKFEEVELATIAISYLGAKALSEIISIISYKYKVKKSFNEPVSTIINLIKKYPGRISIKITPKSLVIFDSNRSQASIMQINLYKKELSIDTRRLGLIDINYQMDIELSDSDIDIICGIITENSDAKVMYDRNKSEFTSIKKS